MFPPPHRTSSLGLCRGTLSPLSSPLTRPSSLCQDPVGVSDSVSRPSRVLEVFHDHLPPSTHTSVVLVTPSLPHTFPAVRPLLSLSSSVQYRLVSRTRLLDPSRHYALSSLPSGGGVWTVYVPPEDLLHPRLGCIPSPTTSFESGSVPPFLQSVSSPSPETLDPG